MKLKTLKDFINEANIKGANKTHREVANLWYDILAHKLKAEAIKWVKELEKVPFDYEERGANSS